MSKITKDTPPGAVCQVWTDASYHPKFDRVGCAALIKDPAEAAPYVLAARYPRNWIAQTESTGAEFIAVAMAVQHLGLGKSIDIHSDSASVIDIVSGIVQKGLGSEQYPEALYSGLTTIFEHPDLTVTHLLRGNPQIKIADEFAWRARRGDLQSMQAMAVELNLELRSFEQAPFESVTPEAG
jgi:ribonuclease HI